MTLAIWMAATALHFVLTARASRRWLPPEAALDDRIFAGALAGVASLAVIVHAAAATAGLGVVSGLTVLGLWQVLVWWMTRRRRDGGKLTPATTTLAERLALIMFCGILLTWIDVSARSGAVFGPDAAHYHIPYAVNLAAGASVFDLPATPHLYPMAGSALAAWFIVPVGTPLMADLAMALAFALIVASVNAIFRAVTGLSGLAWASWLGLALFATPMMRASSAGAADLWFAAGFVSVVALMVGAWARNEWRPIDVVLIGGAGGLLLGSKATGVPAAALLFVTWGFLAGVRRVTRSAGPVRRVGLGSVGLAALFAIGAGGVWLVRNWLQFGSPVAPSGIELFGVTIFPGEPYRPTQYLSVLAELETDSFDLWARTRFYVAQWFGHWYLALLLPALLLGADLIAIAVRRRMDARWWARFGLAWLSAGGGAALLWLLVGAPWTGLERSRGATLRYALPLAVLLPALSAAGLFPQTVAWVRRWPRAGNLVHAGGILGGVWLFWGSVVANAAGDRGLPALEPTWMVVALAVVLIAGAARVRGSAARERVVWGGLVLALALHALGLGAHVTDAAQAARDRLASEDEAYARGVQPDSHWREVFLALRSAERAGGVSCRTRRFFALSRFDEPLSLQPPEYGSTVFYAGRDVETAVAPGGLGACDYVLTTADLRETAKGRALEAAIAQGGRLEVFADTRAAIVLRPARDR